MNKTFDFLYKTFFTIIIIFSTIGVILGDLKGDFDLNAIIIIIIVTLISLIVFFIFDKKPIFLIVTIITMFLVSVIYNEYYNEKFILLINSINDFLLWAQDFINNKAIFNNIYFNIFLILLTIILSLFIYITVFKFKRMYPLLISVTSFFLYRWFWYQNSAFNYYYIFIFSVFSLYTFNRLKSKFIDWKREKKDDTNYKSKYLFIYSFIVTLTIILIAFILPKDNPPIKWRWMDDKVQTNFPQVTEWRNNLKKSQGYGKNLEFDLTFTPYQNQERTLGGNIEINNQLVMEVESDRPLYLKGIVKDEYTGSYWKSEEDQVKEYQSNDDIDIEKKNLNSYTELEYEVNHINLTTSTIFSSYIPIKVNYDEVYYSSDEYEIYTNKVILSEDGYSVKSLIPYFDKNKVDIDYEKNEKYLKLPDTVTQRTENLSLELTKDMPNDYEKMLILQNYLRDNYSYSLKPGNEEYDDFVDNFIFEKSEGYCTYFASSLAVMARTIDIPTRYVEGFITGDKNEEGKYEVYSENAHAWVEAYINGYGWMVFEATPAYSIPDNLPNTNEEETEDDFTNPESIQNNESKEKQLEEMLEENYNSKQENTDSKDQNNNKNNPGNIFLRSSFYIILSLLILIISLFLYIFVKENIDNKNFKRYDSKEKAKGYYKKILNILAYLGYQKELGETDIEFIKKVDINNKANSDLKYFIDTYIKTIYANQDLDYKSEKNIQIIIDNLSKEMRDKKGTLKYIIQKVYNKRTI
ncbi:MAG: transglutaminase-like domain-containing protein [Senegalia sp. (in: firmicutes)]